MIPFTSYLETLTLVQTTKSTAIELNCLVYEYYVAIAIIVFIDSDIFLIIYAWGEYTSRPVGRIL